MISFRDAIVAIIDIRDVDNVSIRRHDVMTRVMRRLQRIDTNIRRDEEENKYEDKKGRHLAVAVSILRNHCHKRTS